MRALFLILLSSLFLLDTAAAERVVPNALVDPIPYDRNDAVSYETYREAKSYCSSDPGFGYVGDSSSQPPGGLALFFALGMVDILTMGAFFPIHLAATWAIDESEEAARDKVVIQIQNVVRQAVYKAYRVCREREPFDVDWMAGCVAVGALAIVDRQLNSSSEWKAWTDIKEPYNLDSEITRWKVRSDDGVIDYPRYDALALSQLAYRMSGVRLCLSDEKTLKTLSNKPHLTWRQAADLILENMLRY